MKESLTAEAEKRIKQTDPEEQLRTLNQSTQRIRTLPSFASKLRESKLDPFLPSANEILQINVGKMCNQTCKHCHVDAGPTRKEVMARSTMESILSVLKKSSFSTVDLTGGAPEMNPHFKWFVESLHYLGKKIIVRCNLTIILANESYRYLPEFFAKHQVQVVSSLPHYQIQQTDRQRGLGVFEKSIQALQLLNQVGYGQKDHLKLDLVYNPVGAFLPRSQKALEKDFKRELKKNFGVEFNSLFTITNMPISRYLDFLVESGNLEDYLEKLVSAFNPAAAQNVMCRNTVSVGWDGSLYDCDFNQMLELKMNQVGHITEWNSDLALQRSIKVNQHCFGCTAGSGSSCGGALEK